MLLCARVAAWRWQTPLHKLIYKLIKKAGSVVGVDSLETVADRTVLSRLQSIIDNVNYPLHSVVTE